MIPGLENSAQGVKREEASSENSRSSGRSKSYKVFLKAPRICMSCEIIDKKLD